MRCVRRPKTDRPPTGTDTAILAAIMALAAVTAAATPADRDLRPATLEGFHTYAALVDARFRHEVHAGDGFHRFDHLPPVERHAVLEILDRGDIFVTHAYVIRNARGEAMDTVAGGRIHHWYAAVFIPGVTLERALKEAMDYDRHATVYAPDIIASRLERHDPPVGVFEVYYRLQSRVAGVTATLDSTHRVQYVRPAPDRAYAISRSIRVQQVERPGPGETIHPEGVGRGYLWAIHSYWRYRRAREGVYVEVEAVTLTSYPWIVRVPPFSWIVRNLPRNVLTRTLEAKRRELIGDEAAEQTPLLSGRGVSR